jgi:shikimate dehydrogenase
LGSTDLRGSKAAIVGAGGAARAVVAYLERSGVSEVRLLVRTPDRAEPLRSLARGAEVKILPLEQADEAFGGVAAIVNASPLGMTGADPMPQALLDAVARHGAGTTIFDLVTAPVETGFLSAGRLSGGRCVDGLVMLVGQAARAFELFFGVSAPPPDAALRRLLTGTGIEPGHLDTD